MKDVLGGDVKISYLQVGVVDQAYVDKGWRFALGSASVSRVLVVRVVSEGGATGVGVAAAAPHVGELREGMVEAMEGLFAPLVVGAEAFDIGPVMDRIDASVFGYRRTKAAVEVALWDLLARSVGRPLYQLWGGRYRDSVPVVRIVPIKSPPEMASNARALVEAGYQYLKIKIGVDPEEDRERVRAIRKAVGDGVSLYLDANQGWPSSKHAIGILNDLVDSGVDLVEQPLSRHDLRGLGRVRDGVISIVEADESAGTVEDVQRLVADGCIDAVSLKTGRLGGPRKVRQAAGICEAANVGCRMGMAGATRLNAAVDLHLVASTPNLEGPCEIGEFMRMETDPTVGVEVIDGMLSLPDGPGHGVALAPEVTFR